MDSRAIGVFDSGLGGLTALKELQQILPNEDFVYLGDTARVPYGTHDRATILEFSRQNLRFLLKRKVKAVLIACGTVSSTALPELKKMTDIPLIGVVNAASTEAVRKTQNRKILILATSATIRSHSYRQAIAAMDPEIRITEKACPLFVPLVENGYIARNNPVTKLVAADYLDELLPFGADTVILGCTHYPIIRDVIADKLGSVHIVEAGKSASHELADFIRKNGLANVPEHPGTSRYFVTEAVENFSKIGKLFLGKEISADITVL